MRRFTGWLEQERGLVFSSYDELWRWSCRDIGPFWTAIWDHFGVRSTTPRGPALAERSMPGARWFPEARLNYAEHAIGALRPDRPALVSRSELRPLATLTGAELAEHVRAVAAGLAAAGVGPGDRVVAYLPNIPEAVIAFLAAASLGAVWSSCSPDFGTRSVVDRFRQIEPKILFTVDGYRYGGRDLDRRPAAAELQAALPSLERCFDVPYLFGSGIGVGPHRPGTQPFSDLLETSDPAPLRFAQVPFDHPLWVLYSSGTTGLPKALVHGHGGILLEHSKTLALHGELGEDDRLFWFTTTGWMMWNYIVGGLLHGAAVVLYDGSPGHPDLSVLWRLAEEAEVTYFGTSASYIGACQKAGYRPNQHHDLHRLSGLGSTGSPLSVDGFAWVYDAVGSDIWLGSISGGTDVCTAFVGSALSLPVHAGEIQTRCLGVAMEAWDDDGEPVVGEVGELVVTEPMPSMPVRLWGDEGHERYRRSYFEPWPGVWRHGDFVELTERGGVVIHGRSDATLNRGGVRIGTAEIYRVVEGLPRVAEALVVNLSRGDELEMVLFVALGEGALDESLEAEIKSALRTGCSPRHVPDRIAAVPGIPKTLNGKKMEVPVRRILSGEPLEKAASRDGCQNPEALDGFVRLAQASGSA